MGIFLLRIGEVAERFKAHAWKACVGLTPTEGSNPSLSVYNLIKLGSLLGLTQRGIANPVRSGRKQR